MSSVKLPPVVASPGPQVVERDSIELTLESALAHALRNSKGIQVLSLIPREVLTDVDAESAKFDPAFLGGVRSGQRNQQSASSIQTLGANPNAIRSTTFGPAGPSADQLQFQQRWQSGTRAAIGYNSGYNLNNPAGQFLIVDPAWNSSLRLSVEQPVFQGATSRINQAGIRIAKIRHDQSNLEFKAEVNRILHDVAVAWWRLHLTTSNVENLGKIVEYAEQAWQNERRKLQLGVNSVADESQARENLEATHAQFAAAKRDAISAETLLRQKLGIDPANNVKLVVHAEPITDEFTPNLESGIKRALASRPELGAQRSHVRMTALDVNRQRDSLLPKLNLLAGYGLTGLNNSFGGSLSDLSSANYGNWDLGLSFQKTLGQRAARSNLSRSELTHTRARLAESALRDDIRYEVRESFDQVLSAYNVLDRQNARLAAANSRFQTHRRMYELGQLGIDRLMPSQQAYVVALRDQNTALVQYNLSINRWHYVTGKMTLDNVRGSTLKQKNSTKATVASDWITQ
ncbi:MAG: TolC family protein [Fuerstiella sp.]